MQPRQTDEWTVCSGGQRLNQKACDSLGVWRRPVRQTRRRVQRGVSVAGGGICSPRLQRNIIITTTILIVIIAAANRCRRRRRRQPSEQCTGAELWVNPDESDHLATRSRDFWGWVVLRFNLWNNKIKAEVNLSSRWPEITSEFTARSRKRRVGRRSRSTRENKVRLNAEKCFHTFYCIYFLNLHHEATSDMTHRIHSTLFFM